MFRCKFLFTGNFFSFRAINWWRINRWRYNCTWTPNNSFDHCSIVFAFRSAILHRYTVPCTIFAKEIVFFKTTGTIICFNCWCNRFILNNIFHWIFFCWTIHTTFTFQETTYHFGCFFPFFFTTNLWFRFTLLGCEVIYKFLMSVIFAVWRWRDNRKYSCQWNELENWPKKNKNK